MWMRRIQIRLRSDITNQVMVFDTYDEENKCQLDQLSITVSGSKYAAILKDKGIITITNLPYEKVIEIIEYEYYNIEIWAGYCDSTIYKVFSGEVSYISKKINSNKDEDVYLCYASSMVARYSQKRINHSYNSSINVYAAYQSIFYNAGIKNFNISNDLKNKFSQNVLTEFGTINSILDSSTLLGGDYVVDTDSFDSNVINITSTEGKRRYIIDEERIPLTHGNPSITSDGLDIYLLPIINYTIGDIIRIPNRIVDTSISQADVSTTYNNNYIDKNGEYMITSIDYVFQNRGQSFEYHIKARALSIIQNLTGSNLE